MERFPQYLHQPYRILWFETDEIVLLAGGYMIGNFVSFKLLLLFPLVFFAYRREKRKRPRGWLKLFGFYLGLMVFRGYPPPYISRFGE